MYAYFTGAFNAAEYHDIIRLSTFNLNPNGSAILFISLIPILVYVYGKNSTRKIKNIVGLVILSSILATILTVSRTGFVGLIILALFYIFKNKKLLIPAALIMIIFFDNLDFLVRSNTTSDYVHRYSTIVNPEKSGRIPLWRPYVKIIKEHPLLGRMAIDNMNFFLDSKERYILNVRHSHNTYLSLASTYGIPVALFFFAPYLMIWFIFRNYPGLSVDIKNMIFIMVLLRMIVFTVSHSYLTILTFLPPILIILYINIILNNKENYAITQVS